MTETSFRYTQRKTNQPPLSIISLFAGILLAGIFGLVILGFGYSAFYPGKIFPGVAVGGVDLSNLRPEEAVSKLQASPSYSNTGKIMFVDGTQSWIATPMQLGLYPDTQASVTKALQFGRSGFIFTRALSQYSTRFSGHNLSPQMVFDQGAAQAFLVQLAELINKPVIEASLKVSGANVLTVAGQTGRELDIPATLKLIEVHLSTQQDGVVPLVIHETQPKIIDLSSQAETARKMLSAPMIISVPGAGDSGPGPWAIDPETLGGLIRFDVTGTENSPEIQIGLDQDQLRAYLGGLAPVIDHQPTNARFIFNDDTRQLDLMTNAEIGRSLDIETTLQQMSSKMLNGEHNVELVVATKEPAANDSSTGEQLGITELVHAETSYFYGSNGSRVNNIKTAASKFHGLLVAPGDVISMSDVMGDISLDNGYSEALIIYGNQTIKGVGGGVCQVSTTLFRAAFFAGFPILERHAHAYRVGYYEQLASGDRNQSLAGLDATVFVPVVDMKFKNDTPYWLLMETYVSETSITWKFYSTKDGRSVEWETTGPVNIVKAPEAKYVENEKLAKNKFKQIDYSADGADIDVNRTVYKDGQVYFQDSYQTHYVPWQAVYEYGPGTKIPKNPPDLSH